MHRKLALLLPLTLLACTDSDGDEATTDATLETAEDEAETTTDTGTESTSDTGTDTGTETDTGMAQGECAQPDPGFGAAITQGAKVAHAELIGTDEVPFNLCEMEGKPLVMEVGAVWCGPCQSYGKALAQDLETTFAEIDAQEGLTEEDKVLLKENIRRLHDSVQQGVLQWMTVLLDNATITDIQGWEAQFPSNAVVAIPSDSVGFNSYMFTGAFPTFYYIDADLTFAVVASDLWPFAGDLPEGWLVD